MKNCICCFVAMLAAFRILSAAEENSAPAELEARQIRALDNQLELQVSANLASAGDLTRATSVSVTFIVKNVSRDGVGIMHVGDNYRQNVQIRLADQFGQENKLFGLPMNGNGKARWIPPGDTIRFDVDVPVALFRMKGERFIAGIRYFGNSAEGEFEGEAFSKPFQLPSSK